MARSTDTLTQWRIEDGDRRTVAYDRAQQLLTLTHAV